MDILFARSTRAGPDCHAGYVVCVNIWYRGFWKQLRLIREMQSLHVGGLHLIECKDAISSLGPVLHVPTLPEHTECASAEAGRRASWIGDTSSIMVPTGLGRPFRGKKPPPFPIESHYHPCDKLSQCPPRLFPTPKDFSPRISPSLHLFGSENMESVFVEADNLCR